MLGFRGSCQIWDFEVVDKSVPNSFNFANAEKVNGQGNVGFRS